TVVRPGAPEQVSSVVTDHAALAPLYVLAATAVLVLLVEIFLTRPTGTRWRAWCVPSIAGLGVTLAGVAALLVTGGGSRSSFCISGGKLRSGVTVDAACSYTTYYATTALTVAVCVIVLLVLGLSAPLLADSQTPVGEYCFLLLCSLLGAVVLFGARDLLTLLVATEALTLPLYVLVAMGRARRGISCAAVFFAVSVVSTAISLLGASLLYAVVGVVHFEQVTTVLAQRPDGVDVPVLYAAMLLVLGGLLFKLAAVPFHGWAPGSYDAAPLPIAAYLTTVSKVGGVVAVLLVVVAALGSYLTQFALVLAVIAAASMTLGNLAALRQVRLGRLLAWSSIAQLGYVLAPVGALYAVSAGADRVEDVTGLLAGGLGYLALYLLVTMALFGAVVLLRIPHDDAGRLADVHGVARRRPWLGASLLLGLAGLAGLPPAFAGLFAKLAVLRGLIDAGVIWLAVLVAVNAVIGLAVYGRVALACFASPDAAVPPETEPAKTGSEAVERSPLSMKLASVTVLVATALVVAVGFAPQLVLGPCDAIAASLAALLM
ncbi:MAG: NADH-quinone oxidoreductase subunit N, partial [Mycobacteriales bacterium]